MKTIIPDETFFQGAISFERGEDYIRPWRLPFDELALHAPDGDLPDKAGRSAGVRLRFQTNSPVIELEAHLNNMGALPIMDLVCDNEILVSQGPSGDSDIYRFAGLEPSSHVYEIYLPVQAYSYVKALRVADDASLEIVADERVRWLTYGSSITHCGGSKSPARSWPATAARALNLNLTCLGYSGNCHLEPMVARVIANQPMDIITLKLGINIYGGSTLGKRTFRHNIIGFVKTIRDQHPDAPIGLITPIYAAERETTNNAAGMTLEDYREELRSVHEVLTSFNDEKLFLFEGRDLLWEADADLLPDNLHPNGKGYQLMGQRAAEKILPVLLAARA
ncbi:SGNH/GDSL hydrolase family protein [Cerasicoccus arenae]|uniref:Lipase n=1 Tax=Cerasicoccus arenae TaxID=424488 RepID=A0A8J3D9C6_9BACT|nr:SGNH/GDSL hydrolase family protein [Cerasicoccus arenae]MBK1859768.1 hypothetical protein [Cerasicoccus arenae]GHB90942.1 lipase [Cerasicoccus arenae]